MKHYNILKTILLVFLASPALLAQINVGEKFISIVSGQTYVDTISGNFPLPPFFVENCGAVTTNIGGKSRKVEISQPQSNPNYLGPAKTYVQYVDGNKPRYITWNITFVQSKIETGDDFVVYSNLDPLTVLPLSNDVTTASNLSIVGLGNVQGGSATYTSTKVFFTPDAESEKGYVLYSVKDSLGTTSNGVIHFIKDEPNFTSVDTLRYTLLNSRDQYLVMPASGFSADRLATKGIVTSVYDRVFKYSPLEGTSGEDVFNFVNNNGDERLVIVTLINKVQNTSSIRDDKYFTPKNTAITFDVFENDLSSNFPIVNFSSELVRDTLGVFTYTPSAGFSGIKNFTYTVNYGQYQAVGKIKITIGNFSPKASENYGFKTLKNQSLVLTYDVPVTGYEFNILNQPQYGTVETFENTVVNEGCNSFSSKSTIIYTPDNNYFGSDSFDVEYCVVNNACVVYKVSVDILNAEVDTLCHCKGPGCVWAGDMNGDGRVSVSDLLSLGRFAGLSGTSRADINYPFRAGQAAADWDYNQPNGLNIKHIDANGDGIINVSDTTAISDHYASIHTFVPDEVLGIKDYPFQLIPNSTEVDSGDLLILDIAIGSNSAPVVDLFGLAFGLNIAPEMIDSASLSVSYNKSGWFADNSATIQMTRQPSDGVIHTAFTKTASIVEDEIDGFKPVGTSGNGVIGKVIFIVEDEIDGFKTKDKYITRRVSTNGITGEDASGERFLLPDTYVDIRVNHVPSVPQPTSDKLVVYPNPALSNVLLHFNGRNEIKGYRVYDQFGGLVASNNDVNAQSTNVDIHTYPVGVYMIQVISTEGTISKKLMVMDKK